MEQHFFKDKEDWKSARIGLFTSSEMNRLMAPGKRKMTDEELAVRPKNGTGSKVTYIEDPETLSDGAITYIKEKVTEMLSEPTPDFYTYEMQWGTDNEPQAALRFAQYIGMDVTDPEFLYCGVSDPVFYTMANVAGGTPDIVIPDAIAEIKCPKGTTHLEYLLATSETFKVSFPDYYCQMQSNMLFCEKKKCYFVSYDPRYKDEHLQIKVIEIQADIDYQNLIVKKIAKAKSVFDQILFQVHQLNKK